MNYFIIVGQNSDYGNARWNDIMKSKNVQYLRSPFVDKGRFLNMFSTIHNSLNISKHIYLPFRNLWKFMYSLENADFRINIDDELFIVFTDIALARYDYKYIASLKKKYRCNLILMINNAMYRRYNQIKRHLRYFDNIYTFSRNDSNEYGFKFQPDIYSVPDKLITGETEFDIFFAGNANDRLNNMHSIHKFLSNNKIKTELYLQGVKKNRQLSQSDIKYNTWLSYGDVVKKNIGSNCILEIIGKKPTGMTLRTLEAVSFGKKLLTNNVSIKDMSFYDKRYIQIFDTEKINEIDISFIKDVIPVEYDYNNEFSPVLFCKRIIEDFTRGEFYEHSKKI